MRARAAAQVRRTPPRMQGGARAWLARRATRYTTQGGLLVWAWRAAVASGDAGGEEASAHLQIGHSGAGGVGA